MRRGERKRFFLRENGFVIAFTCIAATLYWQGMREKQAVYQDLQSRIGTVKEEVCFASAEREELLRQIQSQSDPEWIELVLMKRLGLVPEGQTKVYFEKTQP